MSVDRVTESALALVGVHRRLIHAVTPKHPGCLLGDRDQYEALFSNWHAKTRDLRDALEASGVDTGEKYV